MRGHQKYFLEANCGSALRKNSESDLNSKSSIQNPNNISKRKEILSQADNAADLLQSPNVRFKTNENDFCAPSFKSTVLSYTMSLKVFSCEINNVRVRAELSKQKASKAATYQCRKLLAIFLFELLNFGFKLL